MNPELLKKIPTPSYLDDIILIFSDDIHNKFNGDWEIFIKVYTGDRILSAILAYI